MQCLFMKKQQKTCILVIHFPIVPVENGKTCIILVDETIMENLC